MKLQPPPGPVLFTAQPTISSLGGGYITVKGVEADINGDGRTDLVEFSGIGAKPQLMIGFGQPDGTFAAPVSAGYTFSMINDPAADSPWQVIPADLNADGRVDLIYIFKGSYLVLLNNGMAQFTQAGSGTLPGGSWGRGVTGDFNGDGKMDFIIDTGQVPPLAVLYGNGDGTFSAPSLIGTTLAIAARVAAVDLNHDGITDIVYYASLVNAIVPVSQIETILFHSGAPPTEAPAAGLNGIGGPFAIGDFNHDGIPDLFAVDSTTNNGRVYAGNGDGTFTALGAQIAATDGFLIDPPFSVGDFDHDGNLDIATRLALLGPDVILFLWGDGYGNFPTTQLVTGDASFYLDVVDVNGDGIPDIFANNGPGLPSVVLGRDNDRSFPYAKIISPPALSTLSAGNVLNDGYNDILVSGGGDCTASGGTFGFPGAIYHVQPNGAPLQVGTTPGCSSRLADVDGDGIADLVGYDPVYLYIWNGDGSGVFQAPVAQIQISGLQNVNDWVFRDMDQDGHLDIVVAGAILYGKGGFQFDVVPIPSTLDTQNSRFVVGDVDGDGVADIVTHYGVLYGARNRTFTTPLGGYLFWNSLAAPITADINGDGKDEVVSADQGRLQVFGASGRSTLVEQLEFDLPGNADTILSICAADFNGDGRMDLAVGMLPNDDAFIFASDGQGGYTMNTYAMGVNGADCLAADFNHDGKPDLAFVNYNFAYKPPADAILLHK